MIRSLDVPVVFCTLLGEGEAGSVLTAVLAQEDLEVRAIRSRADNGWYVHDRRGDERQVVAEYPVRSSVATMRMSCTRSRWPRG